MKVDKRVFELEWDKGNRGKNNKHHVTDNEDNGATV